MLKGDRIKKLRNEYNLTQKELGEMIGGTDQTIYKFEKKKNENTRIKDIEKIADVLNVSTDYLLGRTDIPSLDIYSIVENNEKTVEIPVFGKVPAGVPIEALEVDYGYIPVDKDKLKGDKHLIGLKIVGDSMYPFYMDGDTVIIEITPEVESGDDVVVFIGYDYEATLKRFHWYKDYIELEPLNREYPIKKFTRDDPPVRVLGKVVELRREV